MDSPPKVNWAKGANNMAPANRLPDGYIREGINVDPTQGGKLDLRCGFESVYSGNAVRAVFGLRNKVVFVDGSNLMSFDTTTSSSGFIGSVAGAGAVAGAVLNQQLYLSTPTDSLRYDGQTLKPWGIQGPSFSVSVVAGSMAPGVYKVAVTAVGVDGEESGVIPAIISLGDKQSLRVSASGTGQLRLYCTAVNGETLYSQGAMYGSTLLGTPDDSGAVLSTAFMVPMPACEILAAYNSVLLGSVANVMYMTSPMRPHLVEIERGFFQFPDQIDMIAPVNTGVFVSSGDQVWFLEGVETDTPRQRTVADFPAVPGTMCPLPDGTVTWFSRYGQVIGDTSGNVRKLNEGVYAPDVAAIGGAGLLEHNGGQRVITTMRGPTKANRLAAGDFSYVEITDER